MLTLTANCWRSTTSSCGPAHVVDRVAAGGRWHCVDGCGAGGVVDDPCASPLAVAAVLDGRRLYARRTDLQAVIAVDDPGHMRR